MRARTVLLTGAVGYLVGTRHGRELLGKAKTAAQDAWAKPGVRSGATKAADFARHRIPVVGGLVADTVHRAAAKADASTRSPQSSSSTEPTATPPAS
jgi:hypothetical protein